MEDFKLNEINFADEKKKSHHYLYFLFTVSLYFLYKFDVKF